MSFDYILKASKELYTPITKEFSDQTSKKYNNDQWTLIELDKWRSKDLPLLFKSRHHPFLSKDELKLLMDWKLAKGKFRPTLPKLIASNDTDSVKTLTQAGIQIFIDGIKAMDAKNWKSIDPIQYRAIVKASLKELCKLRGVGPATASLILSLLSEVSHLAPPFFSDEAFMYFIRDSLRPSQPIKYNVKEYVDEYIPLILGILRRLDSATNAQTLEQGGWALKTYQTYRIDRLADIKIPFEVEESDLNNFAQTHEILESEDSLTDKKAGQQTKKSKRSVEDIPVRASKKTKVEDTATSS